MGQRKYVMFQDQKEPSGHTYVVTCMHAIKLLVAHPHTQLQA